MIEELNNHRKPKRIFFNFNHSPNERKTTLKRLSTSSKLHQRNRFVQFFFPTRSPIKLHQSEFSIISPLNEQLTKLNQPAVDEIEHSISSLNTQRLQYLTSLNEKTRDLERAAAAFEHSSSKHLKHELDKTKKLSYIFKIAITLCLSLFSFMLGYMIIQLIRDKGIVI